jgi:hypothetical protein
VEEVKSRAGTRKVVRTLVLDAMAGADSRGGVRASVVDEGLKRGEPGCSHRIFDASSSS